VREILAGMLKPRKRTRMGEALTAIGRKIFLATEDFAMFENARDMTLTKLLSFD